MLPANAALTSADWLAPGDNLITRDDNGLEWLDISVTSGLSFNEVSAQVGPGGTFAGWQIASSAQIEGLWTSAGGDSAHYGGWSTENNGVFDVLAEFWGDSLCGSASSCAPGEGFTQAFVSDFNPIAGYQWVALAYDVSGAAESATQDFFNSKNVSSADNRADAVHSTALYREVSPIPVPAAVWLFGTALIGLVGFGKRKTRIAA